MAATNKILCLLEWTWDEDNRCWVGVEFPEDIEDARGAQILFDGKWRDRVVVVRT